ncbi:hypothetical protein BY458DRAFT_509138 [Sporodiniella umbellata]|nr:hypothetical protein BY458DRAFT_509138 [Sporodiniella umbellata]
MSIAKSRLESIKSHISPNKGSKVSEVESLRLLRKPDQLPNMSALDPTRFLLRSASVFANKTAVIHRQRSYTFGMLSERVRRFATLLIETYSIKPGNRVAVLCQNIPPNLESTYAIPAAGAVIVPVNTRLAAKEVEYIIEHSGATVLLLQQEFEKKITDRVRSLAQIISVSDSDDPLADPYEVLLSNCSSPKIWSEMPLVNDETALLSINYTSGSTGRPKGVMVSYRGAYLTSLGMAINNSLSADSRFLWTLPMFHCNGWAFVWALVAVGATQIMLNTLDYSLIWDLLVQHNITHYNGAPTVQNELCNNKKATKLDHPVRVLSGGSALSSVLIKRMRSLNLLPTQVYGLTETYGPTVFGYDVFTLSEFPQEEIDRRSARQGNNIIVSDEVRVLNSETGLDVAPNGKEIGEVCFTGNLVMNGYYKNPEETAKSFKGGVFWSGDLGVKHTDGTIELMDRKKDVIVSGGENISSIEVESVIVQIDQVSECAIVGGPDKKWGERPIAFVTLKDGKRIKEKEILDFCRNSLAGYKCPDKVVIVRELPKTSTGKIQKFLLREKLWENQEKRIN